MQPPLCRILDGPLQPPLNLAEFGAPGYGYLNTTFTTTPPPHHTPPRLYSFWYHQDSDRTISSSLITFFLYNLTFISYNKHTSTILQRYNSPNLDYWHGSMNASKTSTDRWYSMLHQFSYVYYMVMKDVWYNYNYLGY